MIPLIENVYASKGLYQKLLGPICKKYDLTDSQIIILQYLADPNPVDTATKIVKAQRLKKSVVSMSIDDLEKKGFISSYYQEGDRKTKHLKVNGTAKPVIKDARKIQDDCYELLTDGFDEEDRSRLNRYMKKINRNISRYGK